MKQIVEILGNYGILSAIPLSLCLTLIYATARSIYVKAKKRRESVVTEIARALLIWYATSLIVVVWFTELPRLFVGEISLEVFAEQTFFEGYYADNRMFLKLLGGDLSVLKNFEILANIALFVPYGVLLPIAFRRLKWWTVDLIGIGTTALIEFLQPYFGRSFDVDDIIANSLGAAIGCIFAKIILRLLKKEASDD